MQTAVSFSAGAAARLTGVQAEYLKDIIQDLALQLFRIFGKITLCTVHCRQDYTRPREGLPALGGSLTQCSALSAVQWAVKR